MQEADFFRYHGLGNDYLVIDPAFCKVAMTEENVRLICHRNLGVGSDGILYGPLQNGASEPKPWKPDAAERGSASEIPYFQIWNPDGSEAEKSGNGIRIFAQYLLDQGYIRGPEFLLQTLGGKVSVQVMDKNLHILKVGMGLATLHKTELPVRLENFGSQNLSELGEVAGLQLEAGKRSFTVSCVSVGNPHCVVMDDGGREAISAEEAHIYGPLIENHPAFPQRTNVQFLKVLDSHCIQIEIWERGAGYTLASGSSSCAAATAAWRSGLVESPVRVLMPGGEVSVAIQPVNGHAEPKQPHACARLELTGPVAGICYGSFLPDLQRKLKATASR